MDYSHVVSRCGKSADGTLYSLFRYLELVGSNSCYDSDGCTSDCRSALESYKDDLRCCLSAVTDADDFYVLWEDCGVERPALCTDSTLTLTPVENPQSYEDVQRLIYTDFYCAAAGQSIVDTLTECGHDDAKLLVNLCGTNEHGAQCLDIVFDVSGDAVSDLQCDSVIDSCTADCSASLEDFRDQYGCCAYPALMLLI